MLIINYINEIYNIAKNYFNLPWAVILVGFIGTTYIIKYDDEVVGFAIKVKKYLHYIAIKKDYLGKGFGKELMKKVLPNIKSLKVHYKNTKAIEIYEKQGFKIRKKEKWITGTRYLMTR